MEEKKHVGRPTNEEVASRKKKKVVKYSLITVISILLVGGIALFLNRDNIDFSSLMGASIFKTYKYKINYHYEDKDKGFYRINLKPSKGVNFYKCDVNNSQYASCDVFDNHLYVFAKKMGNVKIKVLGENKKGKTVFKTLKIKIGKDIDSPICKINTPSLSVRKNAKIEATITCNESVEFTSEGKLNKNTNNIVGKYYSLLKKDVNDANLCNTYSYYSYTKEVKKINDRSYKVYYTIPNFACVSKDFRLLVLDNTFQDSNGNINVIEFKSNPISIIK